VLIEGGRIASIDRVGEAARLKADARPAESFLLGVIGLILGVSVLVLAVRSSAVRIGLLGVVFASIGLWLINERIREWAERWPKPFLIGAVVLIAAGIATMAMAFNENAAWLASIALMALVAGLLSAGALLRRATRRGWIWGAPVGLLLVLVTLPIPSLQLRVLLALIGLTLWRRGLRRALEEEAFVKPAIWTGVFISGAGAVLLVLASRFSDSGAALSGAAFLSFGVIAVSEGWPRIGLRPIPPVALAAVGLLGFCIGTYILWGLRLKVPFWPALVLAVFVALIGASFVMRGEAVLLVVLAGLAAVWVLVDRDEDGSPNPNPEAPHRIVALGDSYISGEGSPSFLAGTNVKGENENECRRSQRAFPYLVAKELGMALDFYACSGAKAAQLHAEPGQEPTSPPDIPGRLPQLANLPEDTSNVKLVLVSIGGNDALFGEVGQGCTLPGSCAALREVWLANLDQVGSNVIDAYRKVKERLPNVPVVAIPYPLMLTERSCDWSILQDDEHEFLSEFVTVLNDRIRVSAANAGVNFFDPQLFAYDGARICDGGPDDTAMNFLAFSPVNGSPLARINPRNWIHGSLHPNPGGHERTAKLLAPWLKSLLADVSAGKPANPPPDVNARFRLRNVGSARPVLARPTRLDPSLGCPDSDQTISPFASSVLLFDEHSPFVIDAVPGSPVCFTRDDGSWERAVPGAANAAVTRDVGVVRVKPSVPQHGSVQEVVYNDRELGWHLRTVRFCSKQDDCPDNVNDFRNAQLAGAAREVALPVLILFFSGWFTVIGLSPRSAHEDFARTAM
jgi:uncharacterized membrane protein HdeD (DUF308 family)/lysophospholipase L1-like esterase